MIPQSRLHEFLNDGFEEHLPREFAGIGKASVSGLLKDFITFRRHYENRTGARMPRPEQTALMTPPKKVLRRLVKERKRQIMNAETDHSSHSVDHVHVTNRSDVSSHFSIDSAEDENYMEDLPIEELEDGFDEEDASIQEKREGKEQEGGGVSKEQGYDS